MGLSRDKGKKVQVNLSQFSQKRLLDRVKFQSLLGIQ